MRKSYVILALLVGLVGYSAGCNSSTEPANNNGAAPKAADSGKDSGKSATSNPWGSFRVGSSVTMKTTISTQVMGKEMNTSTETKTTLAELTADKAVLDIEATVAGNTTKTRTEVPLTAGPVPTGNVGSGPVPETKSGTDTITVAGKTVNCKTIETDTEAGGNKVNTKVWMSDQVPGGVVKTVSTTSGTASTKTTTEVTDFKAA